MKITSFKAFTLLEAMVSLLIVGILSGVTIPVIMSQLDKFLINNEIQIVEQTVKKARSIALTKSRTVYVDFSQALVNHGDKGGLIRIIQSNGTEISSVDLSQNVKFNAGLSTIYGSRINFDFRGHPVDNVGSTDGFTLLNNKITISYYSSKAVPKSSKSLTVSPLTGTVELVD